MKRIKVSSVARVAKGLGDQIGEVLDRRRREKGSKFGQSGLDLTKPIDGDDMWRLTPDERNIYFKNMRQPSLEEQIAILKEQFAHNEEPQVSAGADRGNDISDQAKKALAEIAEAARRARGELETAIPDSGAIDRIPGSEGVNIGSFSERTGLQAESIVNQRKSAEDARKVPPFLERHK